MKSPASVDRVIRFSQGLALVVYPSVMIVVFALHFRRLDDFLKFRTSYNPIEPARMVAALMAAGENRPILHDPHMLAYLELPLFLLCVFGLYDLGRRIRPVLALVGFAGAITGTIYLGGLFGSWASFSSIGLVDPRYADGATAAFAALTAPRGAFLITRSLAKLAMIGMGVQALALVRGRVVPAWAPLAVAAGCGVTLLFWDLDNWMLLGSVLMLIGFLPMRARLLEAS
jgi:hypothetical protein